METKFFLRMKDFAEWCFQEAVENFENFIPEYEQLNLDLHDPED